MRGVTTGVAEFLERTPAQAPPALRAHRPATRPLVGAPRIAVVRCPLARIARVRPTRFAVDRPTRVPSGVPADVAWRAGGSPTWLRLRAWVPDPLPHRAAAHATRWPATDTTTTTASPTRTADQRRSWGGAVRSPPPLNRPVGWRPWPGTLDRSPTSTCPWAATLTRG